MTAQPSYDRARLAGVLAVALSVGALAACGASADLKVAQGTGPNPDLPAPRHVIEMVSRSRSASASGISSRFSLSMIS